jgi:hypothetical protein
MVGHMPDGRPSEHTRFVQAVLAFAADPALANVERYLAASRALEKEQLAAPRAQLGLDRETSHVQERSRE